MKKIILFSILSLFIQPLFSQNWVLKWQDDFENGTIDEANTWNVEVNGNGGGNQELQYYRRENLTVEKYNGVNCMVLNAKKENYLGKEITSARVNSSGKVYVKYGKIETRIKLPSTANGLWPAFWLLGDDYTGSNWPYCGEIDVMECGHSAGISSGKQSTFMGGALHWGTLTPFVHYQDYLSKEAPYSIQDNDFHLYTLIWTADSIKMYLDQDKYPNAKAYYSKRIAADQPNDIYSYFHKPYHILFNLAAGGAAFTGVSSPAGVTALSADGMPAKMYVDYIRVYQRGEAGEVFHSNTTYNDTEAPSNFTATIGAVTSKSVEFLLNGTDNSKSVIYTISYNGISTRVELASGVQKSFLLSNLLSSTNYSFRITAEDAAGNIAANSPIVINTATLANTECEGTSKDASEGSFAVGYNYNFTTSENNVTLTFEMLDQKIGLVAYLWDKTAGFVEKPMTNIGGNKFSITLTNQQLGTVLKVACKFAFAGGLSVTKLLSYTVGNNCGLSSINEVFEKSVAVYPNPAKDYLTVSAEDEIQEISIYDNTGKLVKVFPANSTNIHLDILDLQQAYYLLCIKLKNGTSINKKLIKM